MKYLKPSRKWSVADMLINAEFCVIFRKSLEKNRIHGSLALTSVWLFRRALGFINLGDYLALWYQNIFHCTEISSGHSAFFSPTDHRVEG